MRLKLIAGMLFSYLLVATVAEAQMNSYGSQQQPQGQYDAPQQASRYGAQQPNYGDASGQAAPLPPGNAYNAPQHPGVEPDQPVRPQVPSLERRTPQASTGQQSRVQQAPLPPFMLNPRQQQEVDQILAQWEQQNKSIKTFDCRFKRWVYDGVFGNINEPKFIEFGTIRYGTPDRGLFVIDTAEKNGKQEPIEDARALHWVCDGKAIYEYSPAKKQVIEHQLPRELQGKAIANSPLPFLFGAEAQKLKQRYFIRIVTPAGVQDQVWLETYPRFQQDASNFKRAIFVINTKNGMSPFGLEVLEPNGKDYTRYQFYEIVVNDSWRLFKGNPFQAVVPFGWQKVVNPPPQAAQSQKPAESRR